MFLSRNADSAIALILGAALAAVSFGAAGGTELSRTTITEVLMLLAGVGVICAAVLWGRPGALYGATSLVAFALLAVLTSLSVLWSVVPELSYIEAGRTLSYLVVFAAAIAGARLAPRAVPGVVGRHPPRGDAAGRVLARVAHLARVARRERALQPHRRAVPVLERGWHRRGDRDPGSRCGSARGEPAACGGARSPIRRSACACSRSC